MHKPAESQFPLHELIRDRWSSVAYSERPVEPEKIGSLLEAARWAPSSYNEQPWSFLVATSETPEEHDRMLSCLVEGNVPWAQRAPVLLLAVAAMNFSRNGHANRHAHHDVGLANENVVLQATAMGLIAHQMAGFDPERARELFKIPDGHDPLTMLAIGYPGEVSDLPEALGSRDAAPRHRKSLSEFVFTGKWGQPTPI